MFNKFLTIIFIIKIIISRECYIKKKISMKGLAKEEDTSLSFQRVESDRIKKSLEISEFDKSKKFYQKNGIFYFLVLSKKYFKQKELDIFLDFWKIKFKNFSKKRKNILNEVIPRYFGCMTKKDYFRDREFKIISKYHFTLQNILSLNFDKNRSEKLNNEKIEKLGIVFSGVFRLIDKINDFENENDYDNFLPVLKNFSFEDLGIKKYNTKLKDNIDEYKIVFNDSFLLTSYSSEIYGKDLQNFNNLGNLKDFDKNKKKILIYFNFFFL